MASDASGRAAVAKAAQRRALAASTPRLARALSRVFLAQLRRTVHGGSAKALLNLDYSQPSWDAFNRELGKVLTQEYVKLTGLALDAVEQQLGVTLALDLNERIIPKGVIARKVTGISGDSQRRINDVVRQGIDQGSHPSTIAGELQNRFRQWGGFDDLTRSRAYTIARTETAFAYNLGAIEGYRQSGIVRQVRVIDAPTCGWTYHTDPNLANGKTVTLDEAANRPVSHPNCVRAFAPIPAGQEAKVPKPRTPKDPWANPKDFAGSAGYDITGTMANWADALWRQFKPASSMIEALQLYSGSGYGWMNNHLRGITKVTDRFALDKLAALRAYIDGYALPDAVLVHRGAGRGGAFGITNEIRYGGPGLEAHLQTLVGQTYVEKGFMSTAMNKDSAFGGVQLHLTVPKGYKAVPVSSQAIGGDPNSTYGKGLSESELLLQAGAHYVIDRYTFDRGSGKITLIGRVLPR